jgi:hypothetical protein
LLVKSTIGENGANATKLYAETFRRQLKVGSRAANRPNWKKETHHELS